MTIDAIYQRLIDQAQQHDRHKEAARKLRERAARIAQGV